MYGRESYIFLLNNMIISNHYISRAFRWRCFQSITFRLRIFYADVGVKIRIRYMDKLLPLEELSKVYMRWLQKMHEEFDQEVTFLDPPTFIFHQESLKELKVNKPGDYHEEVFRLHLSVHKEHCLLIGWFFSCKSCNRSYLEVSCSIINM